jgi:hypothetical protein
MDEQSAELKDVGEKAAEKSAGDSFLDGTIGLWLVDPSERAALFKTANEFSHPVFPCTCSFTGIARNNKKAYTSYAIRRWRNSEEAFGLIPNDEVRPVCVSSNQIEGIECIYLQGSNFYISDPLWNLIDCLACSYNVIFVTNVRMIVSCLKISEQQVYDTFSALRAKFGIYIFVLMNSSKSNNMSDCFFGAASIIETTADYIDLSFNWRSGEMKGRVTFGTHINELFPESPTSLSERRSEALFDKYGGGEGLRELLLCFKEGPVGVRSVKDSMKGNSMKMTHTLLKSARNDEFLQQDKHGHYRLTEKGCDVVMDKEIGPIYYQFLEETFSTVSPGTPKVLLDKSTLLKWQTWYDNYKKVNPAEEINSISGEGTGEQGEQGITIISIP